MNYKATTLIEVKRRGVDDTRPWKDIPSTLLRVEGADEANRAARWFLVGSTTEVRWNYVGCSQGHYQGTTSSTTSLFEEKTETIVAKKAFVATIQIMVKGVDTEAEACDGLNEMFNAIDPEWLMDWGFLFINGRWLSPAPVSIPDDYQAGDFLHVAACWT